MDADPFVRCRHPYKTPLVPLAEELLVMLRSRMVLVCLVMLLASLATVATLGQPSGSATLDDGAVAELDERVARFLEGISLGDVDEAYEALLAGSRLANNEEAIESFVEKTKQIEQLYGQFDSFERVDARRVGRDLVVMKYLYKSEDFPVVWYFTFYRTRNSGDTLVGEDNWRVITLRFDTQFELLGL